MQCRVSPLTPSMCNPVALDFKPQEAVSNLGPTGQISCYESNSTKILGSALYVLNVGPIMGWCQRTWPGIPSYNHKVQPVALDFKPRKLVSNLGHLVHISCFKSNITLNLGAHDLGSTSSLVPACVTGCLLSSLLGVTQLP